MALAMGQSTAEAAEKANVTPQAVSRWKRNERFMAMLAAYEKRITTEALWWHSTYEGAIL
jgi:transcriptional regulator with XRE-family HTH domain